jgi:predicted nucleic acid-binding protein
LQTQIEWVPNALTSKKPLLLSASKDKPVLISALAAKSDVLLTLDKGDFGLLLGTAVYGMQVSTPRDFLIQAGLG